MECVIVENNFLTAKDVYELKEELLSAEKTGTDKPAIYDKLKEHSEKNRQEGVADNCSHNPGCVVSVWEMMNSGTDSSGLNRTSLFSSLSSEEMAQLNRFVQAENVESAQAIYQSLPDVVKKVVEGKEFAEQFGIIPKVGGNSEIIGLGIAGKKQTRESMAAALQAIGVHDTKENNVLIMDKLLDSAKSVTAKNRRSSIVLEGRNGNGHSVRINAVWTILPDGSKRL
ncbi:hypothetical protein OO184_09485 [Photorhabdus sp. APURE]|uniref:hypothetical protein n=1 Tax=Photorhabdus aballayi TaxID=2991723 RepID=UPI00223E2A35|nr:hypothetical protein [Photorhabdus aballayi]MCW7548162.1 hypothetical protein [Photorhabdus aballayi]